MTTIASDGRGVAADGLLTLGTEIVGRNEQKIKVVNGVLYGLCGQAKMFDHAIEWHQKGCVDTPPRCGDGTGDDFWQLLVFHRDGVERFFSHHGKYSERLAYPQAFGSGGDYALAALHLGFSPAQAVALAAKLDVGTGGKITVIDIGGVAPATGNVQPLRG